MNESCSTFGAKKIETLGLLL